MVCDAIVTTAMLHYIYYSKITPDPHANSLQKCAQKTDVKL
jgi:hypothetical protein